MLIKLLEIRDKGTTIPCLAVDMNPPLPYPANGSMSEDELARSLAIYRAQLTLLLHCGYPCDGQPNVLITHLAGNGTPSSNDPYFWSGRTWPVAHNWIVGNWSDLKDGDVVDVEFILNERAGPKSPEINVS